MSMIFKEYFIVQENRSRLQEKKTQHFSFSNDLLKIKIFVFSTVKYLLEEKKKVDCL